MIDGIQIEMTTEELRGFLARRAAYHREGQRDNTAKASAYSGTTVDDKIGSREFRDRAERDEANVQFYEFAISHLIENETFRLTIEEFSRLFIVKMREP